MTRKSNAQENTGAPARGVCLWCREPFTPGNERKVHISRLGAPGVFHAECFEEYQAANAES